MKKKLFVLLFLIPPAFASFSQGIGIGTTKPDASAVLDITTTSKGLLIPRMNTASILAIANPAKGLMVYDSLANQLKVNAGTPATPNWQPVTTSLAATGAWNLTGNSGTNAATQFIGTIDSRPLKFRVNNIQAGLLNPISGNIFWGLGAGSGNTAGFSNVAIGSNALKLNKLSPNLIAIGDSALFNNTGRFNTAVGSKSLFTNTEGVSNTGIGFQSLFSNTTGQDNTATGVQSLFGNTTGFDNTANGFKSLLQNTTGANNTATGFGALASNFTGNANTATGTNALSHNGASNNNTADGFESLFFNNGGFNNTAMGFQTLNLNTTGFDNSAVGTQALLSNTTGTLNTAVGAGALITNTTGGSNTAVGFNALRNSLTGIENTAVGKDAGINVAGSFNVAVGFNTLAKTTGTEAGQNTVVGSNAGSLFNMGFNNILIGANADVTGNDLFNTVVIGQGGRASASNQVRLGNSFTTSIGGVVGFSNLSDGRYKRNIKEDVKGLDFIMKLRPVTYQLDISGISKKLNETQGEKMDEQSKQAMAEKEKTIFSGFVAQEVEQASKAIGYDFSGIDKPKNENDMYGLRYSEFVVPMVKAMQEQQQMILDLKKQNDDLQNRVLALEKK